jgi:small subunit ribosomal protein S17
MITTHKNYFAHDENEKCHLGDVVRIEACRPLSKMKHFAVAEIVRPARRWRDPETGEWKY